MKPETVQYVRYRAARARETLDSAKLLLDDGRLHDTVNRLYYACFYAVSALLLTDDLSSSKHAGIQALFNRNWINTGRLPGRVGHFYHLLFDRRQKGDYRDLVTFNPNEVHAWFDEAGEFVARITEQIEEQLRKSS